MISFTAYGMFYNIESLKKVLDQAVSKFPMRIERKSIHSWLDK